MLEITSSGVDWDLRNFITKYTIKPREKRTKLKEDKKHIQLQNFIRQVTTNINLTCTSPSALDTLCFCLCFCVHVNLGYDVMMYARDLQLQNDQASYDKYWSLSPFIL